MSPPADSIGVARKDAANAAPDAVSQAMAAAKKSKQESKFYMKALNWIYRVLLSKITPKKKTVVRAFLFGVLGMLPFLLLVTLMVPRVMVPVMLCIGATCYFLLAEDVAKQLRWMKRMSGRGPIFWALARIERLTVKVARNVYGAKMDSLPATPTALGTTARGATRAALKWHPQHTSQFSTEKYEVQMRHRIEMPRIAEEGKDEQEAADSLGEWIVLSDELTVDELELKPLTPNVDYEVRVRAVNSKGASEWRTLEFSTKQAPTKSDDGEWAGGIGPGYTWMQSLKTDGLHVIIGPLPAGTKAKQLEVTVMPTHFAVNGNFALNGNIVVSGEFFGQVYPEDFEWELKDIKGGAGREMHILFTKFGKTAGDGALWSQLIKGHPEVDTSGLKRVEKDIEELMAELQNKTGTHAMDGMEYARNMREKMDMS